MFPHVRGSCTVSTQCAPEGIRTPNLLIRSLLWRIYRPQRSGTSPWIGASPAAIQCCCGVGLLSRLLSPLIQSSLGGGHWCLSTWPVLRGFAVGFVQVVWVLLAVSKLLATRTGRRIGDVLRRGEGSVCQHPGRQGHSVMRSLHCKRDWMGETIINVAFGSVFAAIFVWTFLDSGHWAWLVVAMLQVVVATAGLGEPRPRLDRDGTRVRGGGDRRRFDSGAMSGGTGAGQAVGAGKGDDHRRGARPWCYSWWPLGAWSWRLNS